MRKFWHRLYPRYRFKRDCQFMVEGCLDDLLICSSQKRQDMPDHVIVKLEYLSKEILKKHKIPYPDAERASLETWREFLLKLAVAVWEGDLKGARKLYQEKSG